MKIKYWQPATIGYWKSVQQLKLKWYKPIHVYHTFKLVRREHSTYLFIIYLSFAWLYVCLSVNAYSVVYHIWIYHNIILFMFIKKVFFTSCLSEFFTCHITRYKVITLSCNLLSLKLVNLFTQYQSHLKL